MDELRAIHKTVFVPGRIYERFEHGGLLHVGSDPKVPMAPAVWHWDGTDHVHDVMVVGTGHRFDRTGWEYAGTAPDPSGLIWHVMTRAINPPF
jgi:hypothetical protein